MIRLEHVTKKFGNATAVNDFSIDVGTGEICVLIGPSGCGKTTTLRMINRLIEPTSGHIFVDDRDVSKLKPELLRRSIGYAIQNVGLFPHMTVGENILVVPRLLHWEKSAMQKRLEELLRLVGMEPEHYQNKFPAQLSGGEAQRIGVARALAADPPLLLMDEPFGAVDPLTRQRLQAQFLNIQRQVKKTVILVTHDLDEAIRLADKIAVMQSGILLQYDTPENILARPANKFVHDFVGVDRALKQLSRIEVKQFIRPARSVRLDTSNAEISDSFDALPYLWVIDNQKKPIGWIDRSTMSESAKIEDSMVRLETSEISLLSTYTLRDALSKMLGLGFKTLPVVDENGSLIGEISLGDIERATAENGIHRDE
jgi:osmoprotectant transport system ATP-binding protein